MKDRVPTYPGRVRLTPVSGQSNVYDMERADQPTQEGTPLNKSSLLKDSTASLFGLGDSAVPDDILKSLAGYYWTKKEFSYEAVEYDRSTSGTYKLGTYTASSASSGSPTYYISTSYTVNQETGEVELVNPSEVTLTGAASTVASYLKGKYFKLKSGSTNTNVMDKIIASGDVFYFNSTISANTSSSYYYYYISPSSGYPLKRVVASLSVDDSSTEVLFSENESAYPVPYGIDNGYYYESFGSPFKNNMLSYSKQEVVSYVGTGVYGSEVPNSITFSFAPKAIIQLGSLLYTSDTPYLTIYGGQVSGGSAWLNNVILFTDTLSTEYKQHAGPLDLASSYNTYGRKSADGKTIEWYSGLPTAQFNALWRKYYFIGIA